MTQSTNYSIGEKGQKWGVREKTKWLELQNKKRSYDDQVVSKISLLNSVFEVEQYGELQYAVGNYPLYAIKTLNWDKSKPTVLVTGGVHGYETSGVHGALKFLERYGQQYACYFNIIVAPCVSPWGYETINRWNPDAVDPNRSFHLNSSAKESIALMEYVDQNSFDISIHIDLHETTDSDNTQFRPALAARDDEEHTNWNIPDGFYLVGSTDKPESDFHQHIIKAVEKVTHIAPADENGKIIGVELAQFGVINYQAKSLGLCMGFTTASYVTTTEVYPDSPRVDDENCIDAQVVAVTSGLDFMITTLQLSEC